MMRFEPTTRPHKVSNNIPHAPKSGWNYNPCRQTTGAEMGKLSVCCAVVLNLALVRTALAEETTTQLTPTEVAAVIKAVTKCLNIVHSKDDTVSKNFDAHYNLQRVE
jgi:hypothetical protein